jgi:hypothetical protein
MTTSGSVHCWPAGQSASASHTEHTDMIGMPMMAAGAQLPEAHWASPEPVSSQPSSISRDPAGTQTYWPRS